MKKFLKFTMLMVTFYLAFGINAVFAQVYNNTNTPGTTTPGTTTPGTTTPGTTTPGTTTPGTTTPGTTTPGTTTPGTTTPGATTPGTTTPGTTTPGTTTRGTDYTNTTADTVADNRTTWSEILIYGIGGVVLGSLVTYFAVRGGTDVRTVS